MFREWQQSGKIDVVAPAHALARFEVGENEAIALAQERGWLLLIDNSAPRDWSRGRLGLQVIDSPAFVVFLYDQGLIDYPRATAALAQSQAARRVVREALILLANVARGRGDVHR